MPGPNPFGNAAELTALTAYEQQFDIPQVNAFVWPDPSVGLAPPTYSGPLDGVNAALTPAGVASFSYLRGPVPFEDNLAGISESWAFLTQPLPADPATGAVATPLLTAAAPDGTAGNTLMAEYRAGGRRQLSLTFSYNSAQQQFRLLAPGHRQLDDRRHPPRTAPQLLLGAGGRRLPAGLAVERQRELHTG